MREIEFTSPPALSEAEKRRADLHSLFNVLNIVTLQLDELEDDFLQSAPGQGTRIRIVVPNQPAPAPQ